MESWGKQSINLYFLIIRVQVVRSTEVSDEEGQKNVTAFSWDRGPVAPLRNTNWTLTGEVMIFVKALRYLDALDCPKNTNKNHKCLVSGVFCLFFFVCLVFKLLCLCYCICKEMLLREIDSQLQNLMEIIWTPPFTWLWHTHSDPN